MKKGKIIFNSGNAKIYDLREINSVILELSGKIKKDEYKMAFLKTLDSAVDLGYNKAILNLLALKSSSVSARIWLWSKLVTILYDKIPNAQITTIKSKSVFQQLMYNIIHLILQKNFKGLKIKSFHNKTKAFNWAALDKRGR